MWEHLTEQSRRAVAYAQTEAATRGENIVKPEHLLLGILREEHSPARRLLVSLGIAPEEIIHQTTTLLVPGPGRAEIDLRLDPRSKAVLDQARSEAARLCQFFVGPEHLLLGLIAAPGGAAGAVLTIHGPELEAARTHLSASLGQHPRGDFVVALMAQELQETQGSASHLQVVRWLLLFLFIFVVAMLLRYN